MKRLVPKSLPSIVLGWIRPNLNNFMETATLRMWILSLVIGASVGVAAIVFREMIGFIQIFWLRNSSEETLTAAQNVPRLWLFFGPVAGGIIVGQLLQFLSARLAGNVADVIEARSTTGRNLRLRQGLWSALVSAISLGAGASAGREGPVVHLGATLAGLVAHHRKLPEWCSKTLLAAGVASAISASFNAPIAGVLFAHCHCLHGRHGFIAPVVQRGGDVPYSRVSDHILLGVSGLCLARRCVRVGGGAVPVYAVFSRLHRARHSNAGLAAPRRRRHCYRHYGIVSAAYIGRWI